MTFKLDSRENGNPKEKFSIQKILQTEIKLFGNRFSNKKKFEFYLELSVLLGAGIAIKEALSLLHENQKKEIDKKIYENILSDLIAGKSFSKSVRNTNKFSEYEFYSLSIGEESGNISKITQQLAVFFKRKNEQKRIVIAALTYPAIVLSTALLVVLFMLSYVVPMFQDIFVQNNVELPWITRSIISLSDFIKEYGVYFFIFLIALIFSFKFFFKSYEFRKSFQGMLLKIPVLGTFIKKVYLAQFTQAISLLTGSKIPILHSIQLVGKMIQFVPLQDDLIKVDESIMKGFSLHESFRRGSMFDNKMISLIRVSEETNQTDFIFKQLNEQYSQEVEQYSKIMSTILEPFIILIVGLIVAVLLVAMYLPMFELSNAIG